VLDGEIMAWQGERPLPFAVLQRRIGRKNLTPKVLSEAPAAIIVYDILEMGGHDIRHMPLIERRALVEDILRPGSCPPAARISPVLNAESWEELAEMRQQ